VPADTINGKCIVHTLDAWVEDSALVEPSKASKSKDKAALPLGVTVVSCFQPPSLAEPQMMPIQEFFSRSFYNHKQKRVRVSSASS
jgi:hypothetical protein